MQHDGSQRPAQLTPERLARDFGAASNVARDAVRVFHEALTSDRSAAIREAYAAWKDSVNGACGHEVEIPSPASRALAKSFGLEPTAQRPGELRFAVHTYYALLVKRLAARLLDAWHERPAEREHGLESLLGQDPFSWYAVDPAESIERTVHRIEDRLSRYEISIPAAEKPEGRDFTGPLYEAVFTRRVRHALGEHYTPDWLVDHVLDEVGYQGDADGRLLDPSCGSGQFLVRAIGRIRRRVGQTCEKGELLGKILRSVVGFDLNPLAVLSARANYLLAIGDLVERPEEVRLPVFQRDAILDMEDIPGSPIGRFETVVGNPPWIAWDHLPDGYREATKPFWREYGLFTLSGNAARHGGGKKDLSMLVLYAAADRYLEERGRLAMVITQTLFQSKGAGDGFRRFRLGPDGEHLGVVRVHDMVEIRPFPTASNWTATITLEKGSPTRYPVPYVQWLPNDRGADVDREESTSRYRHQSYEAEPIDPDRATSPWFLRPPGLETKLSQLTGPSDYEGHLGANSGGANGVYWVELIEEREGGVLIRNLAGRGKKAVEVVEQVIEPDLLYPLLRWKDVARYGARPSVHLLLAQDPATRLGIDPGVMERKYPRTHAYLKRFEPLLVDRAAYLRYQQRGAFYSMYNVGPYTVAPAKVVWRRMDRRITAAVVEESQDPILGLRPAIPQETCVLVATQTADEAHYLCALLNSSIVGFLATSFNVRGGKGFGTPSMLDFLKLRRFDPARATHAALAEGSRQAHAMPPGSVGSADIQRQIDRLAGQLWGVAEREMKALSRKGTGPG